MSRTWLHLKNFDPQLAFEYLKACGVIRALQFICNEDKQMPDVKIYSWIWTQSFYPLQLFRSFDSDFISVLPLSFSSQDEMPKL